MTQYPVPVADDYPVFINLAGIATHLAIALDKYRRSLALNGMSVPPELADLQRAVTCAALGRLGTTALEQVSGMSDPPPMPRQLLTYDETAEMLACSTRTVERLIATGQLVAVRVTPNTPRIRVSDLSAYVASLDDATRKAS